MLVGTSFSKCLLDLYEGTVNYDDVLVIVTGTDFDPYNDTHWANIWEGYTGRRGLSLSAWAQYDDKEQEFREIAVKLYDGGVLHQPRQYGGFTPRTPHHWLETFVPMSNHNNPAVQKAWEKYQTLAGLTSNPKEW